MAIAASEMTEAGTQPLADLIGAGLRVPLVQGGEARYVNLDYAASAPSLVRVASRIADVLPWYSSVHRGSGYLSLVSTSLYESARATMHRFVGARSDDVVVFTRNTTDSLNLLARAVPGDGEVVYLDIEHHADLLPWQRRPSRCVRAKPTLQATLARLDRELATRPAALLAITGASNVTGEITPVESIVELAHRHGARVVLDAAQVAPHRAIDCAALDLDYVAFSGHKCYAPFGVGVLAGRRDWLDEAPAYLAGGGAVERVTIESTVWTTAPQRHEGGTPNLIGAVALAEASLELDRLFGGALEAHEHALRSRLVEGLRELRGVTPLRIWSDSKDAVGVVAFNVEGHDAGMIAAALACEHGIGLRDGRFCAHPLLERLNGGRGALRASFGLGSTIDDIDLLLGALVSILEHGAQRSYNLRDGAFTPEGDARPVPFAEVDLSSPHLAPPCKG